MSPRHLAERRALYAAIDASGDRHIRAAPADPRVVHSPRSTVCVCDDTLWLRQHQGQHWRLLDVRSAFGHWPSRSAVIDDHGSLVEVAA